MPLCQICVLFMKEIIFVIQLASLASFVVKICSHTIINIISNFSIIIILINMIMKLKVFKCYLSYYFN